MRIITPVVHSRPRLARFLGRRVCRFCGSHTSCDCAKWAKALRNLRAAAQALEAPR